MMANYRKLQDASDPARVIVTTDVLNCPRASADQVGVFANDHASCAGVAPPDDAVHWSRFASGFRSCGDR